MGFGKLVVIAFCLLICSALVYSGRKKPSTDALFECFKAQSCKCNKPERFGGCYDHFTEASQKWTIDEVNLISPFKFDYGSIVEGLQKICTLDEKEMKRLYDEIQPPCKQRYSEAAAGLHGPDESPAFEKARGCLESIASFCESEPDGCMSTG